jgi:DNA-binding MarR family transcriptional regulator
VAEDIVRAFGMLTLGSRMKRIGERLQAETQRIMEEMGVALQAGQYPFLAALDRNGPMGVGDLAAAVGITQPGATRTVAQLSAAGLVRAEASPDDQRQRIVALTAAGQALVARSKKEVWPRIAAAVEDLCGDLDGPLLDQLAAIEDGLSGIPLERRSATPRRSRAKARRPKVPAARRARTR